MMGFVFRLIPPRPEFASDMSPDERATMLEHVGYWSALAEQGKALVFGPVNDPNGPMASASSSRTANRRRSG